jgi:hypothetical protein
MLNTDDTPNVANAGPPHADDPRFDRSEYHGGLSDAHIDMLVGSKISYAVANRRGYQEVSQASQLAHHGYGPTQRTPLLRNGLLIPLWGVTDPKSPVGWQYRPDQPRMAGNGKPIKYETPRGMGLRLDVHPLMRRHLRDATRPLIITEGVRKADAATTAGWVAIALLGVWAWRGSTKDRRGVVALADWDSVAFKTAGGTHRDVLVVFDNDVMLNPNVHDALVRLGAFLAGRGARVGYVYLPANEDGSKVGLDDYLAAGNEINTLWNLVRSEPLSAPGTPVERPEPSALDRLGPQDGATLLSEVEALLGRYVAFPSEHARIATTLWVAHAHLLDVFESTPRLAALSPEPASGKTRLLEVLALLVPRPIESVNCTPAALFRLVANESTRPTVLFDEIDSVFGPKAKPAEELRGLINAGHRRGASAYRCVGEGTAQEVRAFPAFAAMALAGLGTLPDTVLTRSIVLPMRPRKQTEPVDGFRLRDVEPCGHALRDRLEAWAQWYEQHAREQLRGYRPVMPDGVTDRAADVWEPLLVVADLARGQWPERARDACKAMVKSAAADRAAASAGVRLLRDLHPITEEARKAGRAALFTTELLDALNKDQESPWRTWRNGWLLDAVGLANLLRPYRIESKSIRYGDDNAKGYDLGPLEEAWALYVPATKGDDE